MILTHTTSSNVARTVEFDTDALTLTIDFARGDAPIGKRYRYLGVSPEHFENIVAEGQRKSAGDEMASEGKYIRAHVTGGFRDTHIPFAYEVIDPEGNVVATSDKPLIGVKVSA